MYFLWLKTSKWAYNPLQFSFPYWEKFLKLIKFISQSYLFIAFEFIFILKGTQREKAPSNKTQALGSRNIGIWVVGTSNEIFLEALLNWNIISQKIATVKSPFFVIGPFCTHHSICLQKDGYFENPLYHCLEEPMLFLFTMKPFSSVKTKTNPNFAEKLAEGATIHCYCLFDESYFPSICTL